MASSHGSLVTSHFFFYPSSMFSKPRQLDSGSSLHDAAIRALMRRAYSVHEMKQHLARRCDSDELVKLVVELLKQEGHLDDARYAQQFARQRTQIRRQGKYRIARDLRARGVPDRHIEAALAESCAETDEASVVRQRLQRKLRAFRGPEAQKKISDNKMASMYRSLLRAGFSADVVRRELKAATREEVPEAESAPEE